VVPAHEWPPIGCCKAGAGLMGAELAAGAEARAK